MIDAWQKIVLLMEAWVALALLNCKLLSFCLLSDVQRWECITCFVHKSENSWVHTVPQIRKFIWGGVQKGQFRKLFGLIRGSQIRTFLRGVIPLIESFQSFHGKAA